MVNTKKRVKWVDFLKGVGIILVIVAHTSTIESLRIFIHSFHMPLFFIASGYLLSASSHGNPFVYIRKKAKTLLVPYVCFGLFTYVVWLIRYAREIFLGAIADWWSPLKHLFWINSTGLKISGEFWFLTALFFAGILFEMLRRGCKNAKLLTVCVFTIAAFGCYFRRVFDRQLPWSLLSGCTGVGFIYIGYLLRNGAKKETCERLLNLNTVEILTLLGISTILVFLNGKVDMRRSSYGNVCLFWLNAISLSLILMNISNKIYAKENNEKKHLVRLCEEIGKDSMTYVCMNSMVIKAVSAVLRIIFGAFDAGVVAYGIELIVIILSVFCLYYINKTIYALKIEFLLGK